MQRSPAADKPLGVFPLVADVDSSLAVHPPDSEQPDRSARMLCPQSQERHGCDQDTKQGHDVWAVLTRNVHDIPAEMRPSRDDGTRQQECDSQRVERQQAQHRATPVLQLQEGSSITCPFLLPCAHSPLGSVYPRFGSQTRHEPGVEVCSCVEPSKERPQVFVELGIRCAYAVALISRRQRSSGRARDAATFSRFQRASPTY